MTTRSFRDVLRGLIFDNFGLKIVSLIVAVGFFAFIHGAERAQRTVRVSVVVLMPAESAHRALMTQLPTEVSVTLVGSRAQLDTLRDGDIGTLQLDLRTGQETTIQIEESMLDIPPGISIEHIYPQRLELRWDDVIVRQIPVQVSRTGVPAEGYAVKGSTVIEPDVVSAQGPRSVIDVIQYARTVPFDVSGLKNGTYRRQLALNPPPELAKFDIQSVTATVDVSRELETVPFQNLKVMVVGAPNATVHPEHVTVKVTGPPDEVSRVKPEAIVPRVEVPANVDLKAPYSQMHEVLIDVPTATELRIEPERVLVEWGRH
jgi:hypothetical protein